MNGRVKIENMRLCCFSDFFKAIKKGIDELIFSVRKGVKSNISRNSSFSELLNVDKSEL